MKLKSILLLLLPTFLTGCVAAVIAGAAGGLAVYDKRSVSVIEKDARIFHQVHTKLVRDSRFQNSRVVVSSFNRVVLLAGQTPSSSLKAVAEQVAQKTPHVYRVYNEITINNPISLAQQSKDTWITSHIRTKMLRKKGLESGSIHIITENGVVYLMGIATQEQARLAVDVARQINGVQKVVKVFQYIH